MLGTRASIGAASRNASLGLVAKVAVGTSLAAASVAGAGAVGMLPASANQAVRSAIESVTPARFSDQGDKGDNGDSDGPGHHDGKGPDDRFGARVSADAKGESDGEKGVDGEEISDEAPGAAHRSDHSQRPDAPAGQMGETGLARANQTPAAPHAPDAAPHGDAGAAGDHPGQGNGEHTGGS
jgi:hypothetical protein